MSKISITINKRTYDVNPNMSVLQACESVNIEIPRFCYHERLSVAGNCRMCLVEVKKSPKPVVSCAMPVSKGMVIYTNTPLVKKAREAVLEFLLINHPLDCPICDQGGECDLQNETLQYGSDRGRFHEFKRSVEDKELGPIVKTIMTRCIHCTRCVRFSAEVAGQEVLGAFGRGHETEIGTFINSFIKTELSGNLVDLCPVGALTSKPYAFVARSWELQSIKTVDLFDAICSDIIVQTRKRTTPQYNSQKNKVILSAKEEIVRILPQTDNLHSENWISDKSRYAFDGLKTARLLSPISKIHTPQFSENSWYEGFYVDIIDRLDSQSWNHPHKIGVITGPFTDIEDSIAITNFAKVFNSGEIFYENFRMNINADNPSYYLLNRDISSFDKTTALLLIGTNPRYEASLLNTLLRKYQNRLASNYATIGAFNSLKLRQNHLGNSLRILNAFIENKTDLSTNFYNILNTSIIFGAESSKHKSGGFQQNIIRFLGKKYLTKSKSGERLGILHQHVGSLNFLTLGLNTNVRSLSYTNKKDIKIESLFTLHLKDLKKKWYSTEYYTHITAFSTHKNLNYSADNIMPVLSFYEKSGTVINAEGYVRKYNAVVSKPQNSTIKSLEIFFVMAFKILQFTWISILQTIWNAEDCEFFWKSNFDKKIMNFHLNIFKYKEEQTSTFLMPYAPTIINFYLNDIISSNSSIMGECALFLKTDTNFISDN